MFSLGINLGEKVSSESYSYTILPGISLEKFKKYRMADHVQILANTDVLQSVYHKELQQVQAVFYEAGKLELPWKKLFIQMKKPGLVLIKKNKNRLQIEYSQPVDKKHLELDLNSENISKDKMMGTVHIYLWDKARDIEFAKELKSSGINKALILWDANHTPYPEIGFDNKLKELGYTLVVTGFLPI